MFVALYGINNVGKSYHAKLLVKKLKKLGKKAVYIKFPVYNLAPTGPLINKILRSKGKQKISEEELQLLFVLNRYHFQSKLLSYLKRGYTVVAEDYIGTGLAWGVAKGAKLKELEAMNKFLVQEDLSILMVGKRGMSAKEESHIHESDDELVERCQEVLLQLSKKRKWHLVERQEDKEMTADLIWKVYSKVV